ncbi:MAG: YfhO family protein [Gemmatimonadota bacterium]|nr:YfhO family protein [Gemmatimonadota bacterium]
MTTPSPSRDTFTPPRPHLVALGLLSAWVILLSLPMWTGRFLAGPHSDQFVAGFAIRFWGALQWRATGSIPLWNPEMMGGVPVFAGFGDLFYPTSLLRLVLPTITAMNVGFVAHYILAGFFTYLLLRLLGFSWLGAVVGGTAYEMSGVVSSLVSPGHDGKLFVSALLPLMMIGLVLAFRLKRLEGHALLALAVGLAVLSPQYQMAYYALIATGLFALYLAFGESSDRPLADRAGTLVLAFAAVLVGFGISMIQVLPFLQYIPFSPRAEAGGFAWSVSYDLPWAHVPEFVMAGFTGAKETYWGPNPLKLHSEYLGLSVVGLAALGVTTQRRRLLYWLGGIGALFLLVSLGDGTPFYRLWWAVMPYVKQTRAPGMAFYVVAFVFAVMAGLGAERVEGGVGKVGALVALAVAAVLALLAAAGVIGDVAGGIARAASPDRMGALPAGVRDAIAIGAFGSAAMLAIGAALILARFQNHLKPAVFVVALPLVLGADLTLDARHFWEWSDPGEVYVDDAIVDRLRDEPRPYRVLDLGVYSGTALMAHNVSQVLGYHGNEIRFYDALLGGKNVWRNLLSSERLWDLLAVRFMILPDSTSLPGYVMEMGPVTTGEGRLAYVYRADQPPPYAWVVGGAVRATDDQAIGAIMNRSMPLRRIVFLEEDAPLPLPLGTVPDSVPVTARVTAWQPGRMTVSLEPAMPRDGYLVVSENWYPDWKATVDGAAADVWRGNASLLTVPVSRGASRIELVVASARYRLGRSVTIISLVLVAVGLGAPTVGRWRRSRV